MSSVEYADRIKKRYTVLLDEYLRADPISFLQNDVNEKVLDKVVNGQEEEAVQSFLERGCGCALNCQNKFTKEELLASRAQFRALSASESNCYILAQLRVFSRHSDIACSARSQNARTRQKFDYRINSDREVCRDAFLFYHSESLKRLQRLQEYLSEKPITPPIHGNVGHKSPNAYTDAEREAVKSFILNFSEIHGLPDPGRDVRKGKGRLRIFLPSLLNYTSVHRSYKDSLGAIDKEAIPYRTFLDIWQKELPHIEFNRPRSDLCMTCENFKKALNQVTAESIEEQEKQEATIYQQALDHLNYVKKERLYYKSYVHESVIDYKKINKIATMQMGQENSLDIVMSYSWDFAQQLQYPFEEQQVGPIFFKTPRRAQLFGVCCEGSQQQANYLIDEADFPEKNANTVISLLDHFFSHYGYGETHAYLTADNCVGQNKNNAVIQYLMYRILSNLHTTIEMSFLVVGHTKFSPDSHFGIAKKKYRLSQVYTYEQLARVIEDSAQDRYNICHRYHETKESDGIIYRDWSNWLSNYFKIIPNITNYHHFLLNSIDGGTLIVKKTVEAEEKKIDILKKPIDCKKSRIYPPERLYPAGLSSERQWYLYEQIRQHIPSEIDKNLTCPKPKTPKTKASTNSP